MSGDNIILITFDDSSYKVQTICENNELPEQTTEVGGNSSANQKKKTIKYSNYLALSLVNDCQQYLIIVNNIHKLIMIIKKRDSLVNASPKQKAE